MHQKNIDLFIHYKSIIIYIHPLQSQSKYFSFEAFENQPEILYMTAVQILSVLQQATLIIFCH